MAAMSWKLVDEKVILDFPYMTWLERDCRPEAQAVSGQPQRYYVIKSKDWCNVIPVTREGKLVLVRQFRMGILNESLEFPGGIVETDDGHPEVAALRELKEETGYAPIPGAKAKNLGWAYANPALQDNRVHAVFVGPVERIQEPNLDPGEAGMQTQEVSIAEFLEMLQDGRFAHGLMLHSVFRLLLSQPEVLKAFSMAFQPR